MMGRKIFISIATTLLIILFMGIWCQVFLPEGTRPTDWFAEQTDEESPVEESPVEESPVEESPVEESPVEDTDNGHSADFPIIYD